MSVVIRFPNNPATPPAILAAMRSVIVPNTQLAATSSDGTGLSQVYINNRVALAQGAFPAVELSYGAQRFQRQSRSTWVGELPCYLTYYDRWDSQPVSIDSVYTSISADVLRMYANLESNDRLTVANVSFIQTIKQLSLSAYYGDVDMTTVPGITLISRILTAICIVAPYDA